MVSVVATFLSFWLLGRVNRRPHMLVGQAGALFAHLLIGTFAILLPQSTLKALFILLSTITFLIFQQGAISPICWLVLSVSRSFVEFQKLNNNLFLKYTTNFESYFYIKNRIFIGFWII